MCNNREESTLYCCLGYRTVVRVQSGKHGKAGLHINPYSWDF